MRNPFGIKLFGNIMAGFSIFMGLMLAAAGVYIGMFSSGMLNTAVESTTSTDEWTQMMGIMALVGSLMVAMGASTITRASIFIDEMRKMEYEEIQQNRWALIVLALGISSFFIPMMLKRTTGYAVSSDSERYPVKYSLGKWFSMISFIFGVVAILCMVIFSSIQVGGPDGTQHFTAFKDLYLNAQVGDLEVASLTKTLFMVFVIVAGVVAGLGLLSMPIFWLSGSLEIYKSGQGFLRGYMMTFGVIFTIWCTVLLIFAIFSALLEILSAFSRAFGGEHENMFSRILAVVMLPFILAIQGYIIYTCAQTIKGIWSRSDVVSYGQYARLSTIQRSRGGAVKSDTAF